jgi:hypothetical protein
METVADETELDDVYETERQLFSVWPALAHATAC